MCISTWDLFVLLHPCKENYPRWRKRFIEENPLAVRELDYYKSDRPPQHKPGQKKIEYWLSIPFTKEILGAYRTPAALSIKKYLLAMEGYQVQNYCFNTR